MSLPTPHLEKLQAVLSNEKLPNSDKPRIEAAIKKYRQWIVDLNKVTGEPDQILEKMVSLLSDYKFYIDVDLIFSAEDDFLYRQKGQLKLDNSIIEELLPWLIQPSIIPELCTGIEIGPTRCFSAVYFVSNLEKTVSGGGLQIRSKDQDFAISKRLYIKTSHDSDFRNSEEQTTYLAYVAAEIKTNLDKTMFQEACATAHDVKSAVVGSKYYLLCEWLDMTPISTAATDINEILILRGAKRINSDIRKHFSTFEGRKKKQGFLIQYLKDNPFRTDVFKRFINHIRALLSREEPVEEDVLKLGYF